LHRPGHSHRQADRQQKVAGGTDKVIGVRRPLVQEDVPESADAVEEELLIVAAAAATTIGRIARRRRRRQLEDRPQEEEGRVAAIAQLLQGLEQGALALLVVATRGRPGSEEGAELGGGATTTATVGHVSIRFS